MKTKQHIVALVAASLIAAPAHAQSADFRDNGLSRAEGRVSVGIVLPFGGKRSEKAPRLELRMARDTVNWDGQRLSSFGRPTTESRIGVSLEGDSRLFVNGRSYAPDERQGISTLGGIAIGVGVATVISLALLADALRDASE